MENGEFINHYYFKTKIVVTLLNGKTGFLLNYKSDESYINVLFTDDNYGKSVSLEDIKSIKFIKEEK